MIAVFVLRRPFATAALCAGLLVALCVSGCGLNMENHYQTLRARLVAQDYDNANRLLDASKERFYGNKNRLLFYMNKGMILSLAKRYPESNEFLEKAKTTAEDLWTESISANVAALATTDNALPYQGEDFENVLVHFVEAVNYMGASNFGAARVEARQVTHQLELYNQRHAGKDAQSAYRDDAFCRWLSGKLAETERGDLSALNDAWIDYKKALAVYSDDYAKRYRTPVPMFLVQDALRVLDALKNDFGDEYRKLRSAYPNVSYLTQAQAKTLVEQGGTLDVNGELLACQIVNGQPAVGRFSAQNYIKAKELAAAKRIHLMDALSEVGYNDPVMMRGLARKELSARP